MTRTFSFLPVEKKEQWDPSIQGNSLLKEQIYLVKEEVIYLEKKKVKCISFSVNYLNKLSWTCVLSTKSKGKIQYFKTAGFVKPCELFEIDVRKKSETASPPFLFFQDEDHSI